MRRAFLHQAVITLEPGGDLRAPGAAVTVALCGGWDHAPPCPLAPHHTQTRTRGDRTVLRMLFAAEPPAEAEVRIRIEQALQHGQLTGPDGTTTHWQLHESGPATLTAQDTERANRLLEN